MWFILPVPCFPCSILQSRRTQPHRQAVVSDDLRGMLNVDLPLLLGGTARRLRAGMAVTVCWSSHACKPVVHGALNPGKRGAEYEEIARGILTTGAH
jgi:xanthosine utilization system XapX-like protein